MTYAWVNKINAEEASKLASFMLKVKNESFNSPRITGLVNAIGYEKDDSESVIMEKLTKAVERVNEEFAKGPTEWRRILSDAYNISQSSPYISAKNNNLCPELAWGEFAAINAIRMILQNRGEESDCRRRQGLRTNSLRREIPERRDEPVYDYDWDSSPEGAAAWNAITKAVEKAITEKRKADMAAQVKAAVETSVRAQWPSFTPAYTYTTASSFTGTGFEPAEWIYYTSDGETVPRFTARIRNMDLTQAPLSEEQGRVETTELDEEGDDNNG